MTDSDHLPQLARIIADLRQKGVETIVAGGVAANLHGYDRVTRDLDLIPSLDQAAWRQLIKALDDLNFEPRKPATAEHLRTTATALEFMKQQGGILGSIVAIRFHRNLPPMDLDLLVHLGKRYGEFLRRAALTTISGQTQAVLALDDLIALKRESSRDKDKADLAALLEIRANRDQRGE